MKIYDNCTIVLSKRKTKNFILLDGKDYQLRTLSDKYEMSKGGNSNIFSLYDPQEGSTDFAIKICKANLLKGEDSVRAKRFKREIDALQKAKEAKLSNVIEIIFSGEIDLEDESSGKKFRFAYHVTEKAEEDLEDCVLTGALKDNLPGKVQICGELIESISQLESVGIYHRDIKPSNILVFADGAWRISDLGLVAFREEDYRTEPTGNFIGPKGWLSPEAANHHFTMGKETEYLFDCKIDNKSDIFQVAKVCWFVFQSNIPIGGIKRNDFRIPDDNIYSLLVWMLNHQKSRRPNVDLLRQTFQSITQHKYI